MPFKETQAHIDITLYVPLSCEPEVLQTLEDLFRYRNKILRLPMAIRNTIGNLMICLPTWVLLSEIIFLMG